MAFKNLLYKFLNIDVNKSKEYEKKIDEILNKNISNPKELEELDAHLTKLLQKIESGENLQSIDFLFDSMQKEEKTSIKLVDKIEINLEQYKK